MTKISGYIVGIGILLVVAAIQGVMYEHAAPWYGYCFFDGCIVTLVGVVFTDGSKHL